MLDADSSRVEEILNGARRDVRDPDVGLFRMLIEIEGVEDSDPSPFLEQLVRDAYSD
jgi:hypothetical protein